jgi:hypothetical protein
MGSLYYIVGELSGTISAGYKWGAYIIL